MTTAAASNLCVVCRTAPTLTSGSYREVLCSDCATRRETSPPRPAQSPAPARERLADVRECPCGATTTAGWCDACAADRRALAERAEREREARDAEATLERGRRAALVRVPHGWTDDREAYETAVSSPRLRAIAERWSLEHRLSELRSVVDRELGAVLAELHQVERLEREGERAMRQLESGA